MFITRVRSKGKKGKSYVSILLRESSRVGGKVVSHTIAVLTKLPPWLLATVERAVKDGKEAASLRDLASCPSSPMGMRCAESFGAVYLVHEIAKRCHIPTALGPSPEARLALWQVCARVLSPATSLLAMIRLAASCAAAGILGIKVAFNEDDLYANGSWLVARQSKVEAALWHSRSPATSQHESLFLYDVTSSYFEGQKNALAAFGYNRDKVKGKQQVVMGLLTDAQGEPMSVSLFPGNTSDLRTFATQIATLKTTFGQENITLVGDRGMIRGPQQQECQEADLHYISALNKSEIETLLKSGELQMSLFDNKVHEVVLQDGRRLVTRCNPVRREEIAACREGFKMRMEAFVRKANLYLLEHPRARPATQIKAGLLKLRQGHLNAWMSLEQNGRELTLKADPARLKEHGKLDGCYAVVSDLPVEAADSLTLHNSYKDLTQVEGGFRTLKHGHLEIRPWYVTSEDNTRAHALTAMLALKIRRRLQIAWEPLNLTVEEGLQELAGLRVMEVFDKESGAMICRQLPEPSTAQAVLLKAAGVKLPDKLPVQGPKVGTRVELQKRRKSHSNH